MTKKDIIVGTIAGVLGNFAYAFIAGLENNSAKDVLKNILTTQIPLWFSLLMVITVGVLFMWASYQKHKNHSPVLPFLDVTEQEYGGFIFQWVWKKDEKTGKYKMSDLWPLCPTCGKQLRVELYNPCYHCTDGHAYDLNYTISKKRDFLHEFQREFKDYADFMDLSID